MAHFIGYLGNTRIKKLSCTGTKNDMLFATLNGWDFGCHVIIDYDKDSDSNNITITITGGSNNPEIYKTMTFNEKSMNKLNML